jgi:DNA recombination protein RmuC
MEGLDAVLVFVAGAALGAVAAATACLAILRAERRAAAEHVGILERAGSELREAFQSLSSEALRQNNQSFLELARTSLGELHQGAQHELEKRRTAIEELVRPLRESLQLVDAKLQVVEKERREHYGRLTEQLRSVATANERLQSETQNLVRALRAPSVRGRWGEIQLRRVVELAGMLEHCDFQEQQTAPGETRLRPDLLVRLPGAKNVVVDAKAPLEAYLAALETSDEAERARRLADHARQVRDHMKKLAGKEYQTQFQPSPEFVVMFLPGETFFSAALEQDPGLIEFGVEQRVIPASPTTLIALLRAVAYGWKQEQAAASAQEISELGRELHGRLAKLANHFVRLGAGLERVVQFYNDAVGSLENRVLVQARRFRELGAARDGEEIETPAALDRSPRRLAAPELKEADGDTLAS